MYRRSVFEMEPLSRVFYVMSEYKRANSFGTGYLDTSEVYKVEIKNISKKRFFEVAGDVKAETAFSKVQNDPVPYKYNTQEKRNVGLDGKDVFEIKLTTPEGQVRHKTMSYTDYMTLLKENGIVTEGRWYEWGKNANGDPMRVKVSQ